MNQISGNEECLTEELKSLMREIALKEKQEIPMFTVVKQDTLKRPEKDTCTVC
jgi:hypothetical protein